MGRFFDRLDVDIVKGFAEKETVLWQDEPIVLKSGRSSHVYVSARGELTDDPEFLWTIGHKIALTVQNEQDLERDAREPLFIGIPTAGTPLAVTTSLAAFRELRKPWGCRTLYDERKLYGADNRWVAGDPIDQTAQSIWVIDNTVTDAGTKRNVLAHMQEDGYAISEISMLVLIDRQQGGLEALQAMGLRRVIALYSLVDIAGEFERLGHWQRPRVKAVKKEIRGY